MTVRDAPRCVVIAVALAGLGAACRVSNVGTGPSALVFGATAVAATAVYRQATGGCWAACNAGWVCNTETGRCEPEARERRHRLRRTGDAGEDGAEASPGQASPTDAGAPAEANSSSADAGRSPAGTASSTCSR